MAEYRVLFRGPAVGLLGAFGMGRSRSSVALTDDTFLARMGWALKFEAPTSSIVSVQRVRNPALWWGWGVHGARGHYLMNGSLRNVVRIAFDPPVRARTGAFPLTVRMLDVSLEDPDGFIAQAARLGLGNAGSGG